MSPGAAGASVGDLDTFDELLARWIDAEARGDPLALDSLLHADFRGDGPLGYVLAKHEWLDRYRLGDLVNRAFAWEHTDVREHGDTIFVRGVQSQEARYRGEDCSGRFLASLVAVRQDQRWTLVNLQLSRMDGSDPDGPDGPDDADDDADADDGSATCASEIGQVADVADER
jgi:hypothetical protein